MSIDSIIANLGDLEHADVLLFDLYQNCANCESRNIGIDEELRLYCLDDKKEIGPTNSKEGRRRYFDLLLQALVLSSTTQNDFKFDKELKEKLVKKIEEGYRKLLVRNPLPRDYYALSLLFYYDAVGSLYTGQQELALEAFHKEIEALKNLLELTDEVKYWHHAAMKAADTGFFLGRFEDMEEESLEDFKLGVKWGEKALELAGEQEKEAMKQGLMWPLFNLGVFYLQDGQDQKAKELFNQALDLLPSDPMDWKDINESDSRFLTQLTMAGELFKNEGEEEKSKRLKQFETVLSKELWKRHKSMITLTSYSQVVQKRVIDKLDEYDYDGFLDEQEKYIELFTGEDGLKIYKKESDSLLQMLTAPVLLWSEILKANGKTRVQADLLLEAAAALEELYKSHESALNRYFYFQIARSLAENFMERDRVKKTEEWIYKGLVALNKIPEKFPDETSLILNNQMQAIELQQTILPYLQTHLDAYENLKVYTEMMAIFAEADAVSPFIDVMDLFHRYFELVETYAQLDDKDRAAYFMMKAVNFTMHQKMPTGKELKEDIDFAKEMIFSGGWDELFKEEDELLKDEAKEEELDEEIWEDD